MTTNTPDGDALHAAIPDIRRITAEENIENFSNDKLLNACIDLVQADDAAREDSRNHRLDGDGDFLATLNAAWHRASSYDDSERAIITRAISRANRALANRQNLRPTP